MLQMVATATLLHFWWCVSGAWLSPVITFTRCPSGLSWRCCRNIGYECCRRWLQQRCLTPPSEIALGRDWAFVVALTNVLQDWVVVVATLVIDGADGGNNFDAFRLVMWLWGVTVLSHHIDEMIFKVAVVLGVLVPGMATAHSGACSFPTTLIVV